MTTATIQIRHPQTPNRVNSIGYETRLHLFKSLRNAISDPTITSIILIGHGRNFSAGADIREFSSPRNVVASSEEEDVPNLLDLTHMVENSTKPIVAAVRGVALGGGLELALASHYRICTPESRFGLPECNIGIIPGAGGTQRLPRLCGISVSLELICSGRMVVAEEAFQLGIVDGVVVEDGRLEEVAMKWARWAELMPLATRRLSNCHIPCSGTDKEQSARICNEFAKTLPRKERGGEAVHGAVRAIRASFESPTSSEGYELETEIIFDLLLNSSQGRGLRHAFFAERQIPTFSNASKLLAAAAGEGKETMEKLLKGNATIGVIGAGTMGGGIAISFLRAGYSVVLVDNNDKGLERGVKLISKIIDGDVTKGKLSESKADAMKGALQTGTTFDNLRDCHMIVEAVYENLELKKSIFQQLDSIVPSHTLLLTNTSTLDIDVIASSVNFSRRSKCGGMHFFSPAHVMKLVEIVRGKQTSDETVSIVQGVTKHKLKKIGVTVGNCDGFVGNRMLHPYTSEILFVVEDGSAGSVMEVDETMKEFGFRMGPFEMSDLAGNDVGYFIRKERGMVRDVQTGKPGPNRTAGMRYTELGDDLVTELGRMGQKVGKGWYDYDIKVGKGRKPLPSAEVSNFIVTRQRAARKTEDDQQRLAKAEIVERLLYPLVNEGFKILEEKIAYQPSDIDVIYLYGYGWPAWRGGPMHWADHDVGLPHLLSSLEKFHRKYPGSKYFVPSELLKTCVGMGLTVEEYYKRGEHKGKRSKL